MILLMTFKLLSLVSCYTRVSDLEIALYEDLYQTPKPC